jgi:hypothetical protein
MHRRPAGFTLVETATVVLLVSMVTAGMLKGQALIQAARVRSLIAQQEDVKASFAAFRDRYKALPGDYAGAGSTLSCSNSACVAGNGDGRIATASAGVHENLLVWTHLSAAGFITGTYLMANAATHAADESNTPKNAYGRYLDLRYDSNWGPEGNTQLQHNVKTGNQIPVRIIAEIDLKVDDGRPYSGTFQFSAYGTPSTHPNHNDCVVGQAWNIDADSGNCGGADRL